MFQEPVISSALQENSFNEQNRSGFGGYGFWYILAKPVFKLGNMFKNEHEHVVYIHIM